MFFFLRHAKKRTYVLFFLANLFRYRCLMMFIIYITFIRNHLNYIQFIPPKKRAGAGCYKLPFLRPSAKKLRQKSTILDGLRPIPHRNLQNWPMQFLDKPPQRRLSGGFRREEKLPSVFLLGWVFVKETPKL